jgi:hypothetical protein
VIGLRWRALSREEMGAGSPIAPRNMQGAVTVARSEHYSEICVLEFQQEQGGAWQRVEGPLGTNRR